MNRSIAAFCFIAAGMSLGPLTLRAQDQSASEVTRSRDDLGKETKPVDDGSVREEASYHFDVVTECFADKTTVTTEKWREVCIQACGEGKCARCNDTCKCPTCTMNHACLRDEIIKDEESEEKNWEAEIDAQLGDIGGAAKSAVSNQIKANIKAKVTTKKTVTKETHLKDVPLPHGEPSTISEPWLKVKSDTIEFKAHVDIDGWFLRYHWEYLVPIVWIANGCPNMYEVIEARASSDLVVGAEKREGIEKNYDVKSRCVCGANPPLPPPPPEPPDRGATTKTTADPPTGGQPTGSGKNPPPSGHHMIDLNGSPALCTASILVADKERPFAVPTRLIGPEGKPVEVTEVLVVSETETTSVKRADDKKFMGLLPPKPAKVIIAAGGIVLAVVSTLGSDGGSPGGVPAIPTGGTPTGGGVVAPPPSMPTEPARLVDVARTPTRLSPTIDLAPSGPSPSATPPTSSVPPKTLPVEPTIVRAQDEVQPLVANGDFTPAKIDEYQARIDNPQATLSTEPQVVLMTEDQAVLINDGTKEMTGPAQVTITGPEGAQTGAITSYTGKVVVSKTVVGTEEAFAATVVISGLEPTTIVDWSIVLPPDGHFTSPEYAAGNTAGGRTSVFALQTLSFPITFDLPGTKLIPLYLEPVPTALPPRAPYEVKEAK